MVRRRLCRRGAGDYAHPGWTLASLSEPLRIAFGLLGVNEEAFPEHRFQEDDGNEDGDSRHQHSSEHIYPHATLLLDNPRLEVPASMSGAG